MKRLLLDTHVLLWWLAHDPALGPETQKAIRDAQNEVYVSAATTWEASIKKALGKLEAPDDLDRIVEEERFLKLPISLYHGQMAGQLPAYHRDPFDRTFTLLSCLGEFLDISDLFHDDVRPLI